MMHSVSEAQLCCLQTRMWLPLACHWQLCLWPRKGVKPTAAGTAHHFQYSTIYLIPFNTLHGTWIDPNFLVTVELVYNVYNLILQFPSSFRLILCPNSPCDSLPPRPLSVAHSPQPLVQQEVKKQGCRELQWAMQPAETDFVWCLPSKNL